MRYLHLTLSIRYQIAFGVRQGLSEEVIARRVGFDRSTIYRELKRGATSRGYDAETAQRRADVRAQRSAANHPTKPPALWREVTLCVHRDYSPDQIRGRLECLNLPSVSIPAIYAYIRRDKAAGGCLHRHLRYATRRKVLQRRRALWGDKVSIRKRSASGNARKQIGHWEGDTLMGSQRRPHKLLALVERKSRYLRLERPKSAWSRHVSRATIRTLRHLPTRSITFDNGTEFADYKGMQKKLQCPIYFADPGNPGQRGTCENTIGIIRQYIPKGTSGRHLSINQIHRIADKLNHRPRKCLGYRTPYEVFFNLTPVALRT